MLKVEVERCGQLFDLMAVHIPVGNKGSPKDENGLRKQPGNKQQLLYFSPGSEQI
jgi:hypothetical protein